MRKEESRKRKPSLRFELIALCTTICICAMLILGIALMAYSVFSFSERSREDIQFYMENVNKEMENKVQFLEDLVISCRSPELVYQFFKAKQYDSETMSAKLSNIANLFSEKNHIVSKYPFVEDIYLFRNSGGCIYSQYYPTTVSKRNEQNTHYINLQHNLNRPGEEYVYYVEADKVILFFRLYDDDMQEMGNGMVGLNKAGIQSIYSQLDKYGEYRWGLLSSQGQVLDGDEPGETEQKELVRSAFAGADTTRLGGEKYLMDSQGYGFGFRGIAAVPENKIYDGLKSLLWILVAILFTLVGVVGCVAFFVTYRFTRPLQTIAEKIALVGGGDFQTKLGNFRTRELDEVSVVFNEMTDKIDFLVTQVYEKQLLASELQVKYLQSQMNPHFLFNVLSIMAIKAKFNKDEEVYRMVSALSTLLQGKIFREGEITIPLREEIRLVEFYLYLQSIRFSDKIDYQIICEEDNLLDTKIPRLCIEPVVENAVLHGVEPKEGSGNIKVHISAEEGKLKVLVEDDGIGFDKTKKWDEKKQDTAVSHTHVGIWNIERLIKNLYGEEYGMKIESRPGEGTKVWIFLPLKEGE